MSTEETGAGKTAGYVTQIISRRVKPERQAEYETWLKDRLMPALSGFPGYEGVTILRPGETPSKEYVIIQRWRDYDHLCAWAESELRREVLAASEAMSVRPPSRRRETGLEVWFQLPGEGMMKPPPRYKMFILIWMVIAPLSLIVNWALGPALIKLGLPLIPAGYLKAGIITAIMTYLAMPWARKLLAKWLDK
jgi:antibiotic biosynthesis monooxygenase (ABM) superfamily enzyme